MIQPWINWLVGALSMMVGIFMIFLIFGLPYLTLPGIALSAFGAHRLFLAWKYG